jgi:hypothetical protein
VLTRWPRMNPVGFGVPLAMKFSCSTPSAVMTAVH